MKWQSIETAPKDGTRVLLLYANGRCVCGAWNIERYSPKPRPFWDHDLVYVFSKVDARKNQPAYWMPFPDAPKEQS